MTFRKFLLIVPALLIAFPASPALAQVLRGKPVTDIDSRTVPQAALPVIVGPKKIVAVQGFENKVENPDTYWYRNPKLGTGMSDMLVTSLMDTNAFIVLEREMVESILSEQNLAASGRATQTGHAKIGLINQAQALITGAVTVFEEGTAGKAGGIGFGMKNVRLGIGGAAGESQVAVDIRIYDTQTSQVLAAKTCKGYAQSKGRSLSIGLAGTHRGSAIGTEFGGADFKKTPIGDATRDAITAAVNFIATELSRMPWRGRVIRVAEDGKVYINCGQRENIRVGDAFTVFNPGESLIDPDTGETLGSMETMVGEVQVIQVQDKFSIASKVSGAQFNANDIIRWKGV